MSATSYLLFFFSALGVFNGLLLASWLVFRQNKQVGDNWLAMLLLLLCIRIGKSVAFYFTPSLDKNILQLGLTACFLIGPCIYAYITHQTRLGMLNAIAKWTFASLVMFIVVLGIVYPYKTHLELWQYWVYRGSSYLWLVCLLLSFFHYREKIQQFKGQRQALITDKPLIVLMGGSLIWLAYFTASYTSYIMGALSFSLTLYLSVLTLFKAPKEPPLKNNKYANNKLTDVQVNAYSNALEQLINEECIYTDPQLSLPRLAKRLGIPHTLLSQLLNDHYQMNFKQYINTQRVTFAQTLLLAEPNTSIDDIAEQSGFSSSSTFYSAFKHKTGMTPNRYRTAKL